MKLWVILLFLQLWENVNSSLSCNENACEIEVLHPHLFIAGMPPTGKAINTGHKLRFICGPDYELDGSEETECLQTGQWSPSFPTCSGSVCRNPPLLEDGDTVEIIKPEYQHNERVKYMCQNRYTMDGGPFKTCTRGVWTGEMRCLKPCTVDIEQLDRHHIQFAYGYENKLYPVHNDHITFACKGWKRPAGSGSMRRQCIDGTLDLPTCQ